MDLSALNPDQQKVVNTLDKNLLLLAPAGTGKTDTLSLRIARILELGLAAPEEILCLTFTNKACKEMTERVETAFPAGGRSVVVRTIHGFCCEIVRQEAKRQATLFSDFTVFDEDDCLEIIRDLNVGGFSLPALQNLIGFVKESRAAFDLYSGNEAEDYRKTVARLFTERPDKMKFLCVRDFQFDAELTDFFERQGADFVLEYNRALAELHGLDFCDLIERTYALFRDEAVARRWRERFRFITIDEVQDTSELEYTILSKLFDGRNVLLTGDYFQTIYEWRGSQPLRILERYREAYAPTEISFFRNYRATRTLLRASHACLEAFFPAEISEMYSEDFEAASPNEGEPIVLKACRDLWEEGEWIYKTIRGLGVKDK